MQELMVIVGIIVAGLSPLFVAFKDRHNMPQESIPTYVRHDDGTLQYTGDLLGYTGPVED